MLKWNILWHAALLPTLEICSLRIVQSLIPSFREVLKWSNPSNASKLWKLLIWKMSRRAGPQICLPAAQRAPLTKNCCDLCRSGAKVSVFSTMSNQPWALMTDRARHRSSSTVVLAFTTAWLDFKIFRQMLCPCTQEHLHPQRSLKKLYICFVHSACSSSTLCAFHQHKKWTHWHPFA